MGLHSSHYILFRGWVCSLTYKPQRLLPYHLIVAPLAEVQACAQRAISFIEGAASKLSGGLPAHVRTIAHCGHLGTVAMSMLGECTGGG